MKRGVVRTAADRYSTELSGHHHDDVHEHNPHDDDLSFMDVSRGEDAVGCMIDDSILLPESEVMKTGFEELDANEFNSPMFTAAEDPSAAATTSSGKNVMICNISSSSTSSSNASEEHVFVGDQSILQGRESESSSSKVFAS